MNRINKEAVKSIILIILVFSSILQLGILWNYQSHRLPFNFLSALFNNFSTRSSVDADKVKNDYFMPYRVVVSEGFYAFHWIVPKKSDTYNKLWDEAKVYLKDILNSKPDFVPAEESWGEIVIKKAFIFEFKANIRVNLLAWFLDVKGISPDQQAGVLKMAVLPHEDVNENVNTVYILDDAKVYKFNVRIPTDGLSKEDYKNISERLGQDDSLKTYSVIKELIPDEKKVVFPIRQDMLVASGGRERYRNFSYSTPKFFNIRKSHEAVDLEEIAKNILGSEKDSYDLGLDTAYDAGVLKSLNNVYRVYRDGLLEYKYLSAAEEADKVGSISDAFRKVLEFIGERKPLTSGVEYYLSGVREDKGFYEFTFDYLVDGIPVFFDYESQGNDKRVLNNAITISANSRRVISCWWIMKSFAQTGDAGEYNMDYNYPLDNIFSTHKDLSRKSFSVDDIYVCYAVKPGEDKSNLKPVWVVRTKENRYYTVPMRK